MMYEEFLKLAKIEADQLSFAEYADTVEVVYIWHPSIDEVNGKKQIVEFYKHGLIQDLLPRAKKLMDLEGDFNQAKYMVQELKRECDAQINEQFEIMKVIQDKIKATRAGQL